VGAEAVFLAALFAAPALLAAGCWLFFRAGRGRAPGAARLVAGNALLSLLLLSLVFVALEVQLRWLYDDTDVWNRSRVSRRWFERHWIENQEGVRDDVEYARARSKGVPRITFLGDSYTAAHGVKDVGERFVNRIRRERPDWEVHAYAYNGANTPEEIEVLRRITAEGYELDVVVLVYCYNDIDSQIPEFQALYRRVDLAPDVIGPLLEASYAADWYYQRWRLARIALGDGVPYAQLRRDAYLGRPWEGTAYNLELLLREVRARGGRFAVVTFPWMQMLLAGDPIDPMHAVLERFWREQGVPHLDLLPAYRELPADELVVNARDTHPNARAHAIAADAILRFLEREVVPPAARASAG
jgi:hypothetical protein